MCVYATLLQSDTLNPYGRAKTGTSPVGVELRKKPKDLSVSEREDREYGEGKDVYDTDAVRYNTTICHGGLHQRMGLAVITN